MKTTEQTSTQAFQFIAHAGNRKHSVTGTYPDSIAAVADLPNQFTWADAWIAQVNIDEREAARKAGKKFGKAAATISRIEVKVA